jgi:histidinol-phosphatase (PHP family)
LVIELNTSGFFKKVGELYPSIEIIKKSKFYKIEFTVGSDAHSPNQVAQGFETLKKILEEEGIKKLITFKNHKKDYLKIF